MATAALALAVLRPWEDAERVDEPGEGEGEGEGGDETVQELDGAVASTCHVKAPPPPPFWPVWVVVGIAGAVAVLFLRRVSVARAQERSVRALADHGGPRTFRLDETEAGALPVLDPDALREAAFHLSAPSADAPAPWLDAGATVRATVRRAGRLVLRHAAWREHRPVLVIEDVSPGMARWPDHARQLVEALQRQAGRVVHRTMLGTPGALHRGRGAGAPEPLEQVLAGLSDPAVVVVSDAAALDRVEARRDPAWLGLLGSCTWLHPLPAELWGDGARWLSSRVRVVPMSAEGLMRLGVPRPAGGDDLPPRWRPPRPGGEPAAQVAAWRGVLGEEAFVWLAAGALLARAGALTARLLWALRARAVVRGVSWARAERVWDIPGLRVGADGTVVLEGRLRAALCDRLTAERPGLGSAVARWAVGLVEGGAAALEEGCPAWVAAEAARVRLLAAAPEEESRREARRRARRLARQGRGGWLAEGEEELRGAGVRVALRRTLRPGIPAAVVAGLVLVGGLALASLGGEPLRRRLYQPEPEFQALGREPLVVPPGEALAFCDRHQLREAVWVRAGEGRPVRLEGTRAAPGEPRVWTIAPGSELWAGLGRPAEVELRLAYEPPGWRGPWRVRLSGEEGEDPGPPVPPPVRLTWVRIPGGDLRMGSPESEEGRWDAEGPVHDVRVRAFEMTKTEVTVAQYRRCVEAGACSEPNTDTYCNWGKGDRDDHPVNCVDWSQARAFAAWAKARLPTEAEWEHAARSGGRSRRYAWGNEEATCRRAVIGHERLCTESDPCGCGENRTWPVCSKPAGNSAQGLCDLAGNVWEWVEDDWHGSYRGAPADGSAWVDEPRSSGRVTRGGSWYDSARFAHAASRDRWLPGFRPVDLGFRLARSFP